ncbi:MAG: hypothetical protein JSS82_11480 [Bacteroidetes bacterium]|nr:hypothetical protein [Bacteroidota bacterium]
MRPVSDLTCKIFAFSAIPEFPADVLVDWAYEMVQLGYDTPDLLMLAATSKPANYFEVLEYAKAAMAELQLPQKTGGDAIISFYSFYIKKIAAGENIKQNLFALCDALPHQLLIDYAEDFRLLCFAWEDLDCGRIPQYYWEGADSYNIRMIVQQQAVEWMANNKEAYKIDF